MIEPADGESADPAVPPLGVGRALGYSAGSSGGRRPGLIRFVPMPAVSRAATDLA